jgi:hypothetical protein
MGVAVVNPGVVCPPVMGPLARAACGLPVEGVKRRKLLVLLCAYADANGGVCRPPTRELLARIAEIRDAKKLFGVARRLEEDGYLRVLPKGGGFELLVGGDVAGGV